MQKEQRISGQKDKIYKLNGVQMEYIMGKVINMNDLGSELLINSIFQWVEKILFNDSNREM